MKSKEPCRMSTQPRAYFLWGTLFSVIYEQMYGCLILMDIWVKLCLHCNHNVCIMAMCLNLTELWLRGSGGTFLNKLCKSVDCKNCKYHCVLGFYSYLNSTLIIVDSPNV